MGIELIKITHQVCENFMEMFGFCSFGSGRVNLFASTLHSNDVRRVRNLFGLPGLLRKWAILTKGIGFDPFLNVSFRFRNNKNMVPVIFNSSSYRIIHEKCKSVFRMCNKTSLDDLLSIEATSLAIRLKVGAFLVS